MEVKEMTDKKMYTIIDEGMMEIGKIGEYIL